MKMRNILHKNVKIIVYKFSYKDKIYYGSGINPEATRIAIETKMNLPKNSLIKLNSRMSLDELNNVRYEKKILLKTHSFVKQQVPFRFYLDDNEQIVTEYREQVVGIVDKASDLIRQVDLLLKEDFKLIEELQDIESNYRRLLGSNTEEFKTIEKRYLARINRNYNTGYYVAPPEAYGVYSYSEYKSLFIKAANTLRNRTKKFFLQNYPYNKDITIEEALASFILNEQDNNRYQRIEKQSY